MYQDIALGGKDIFVSNGSKTLLIMFHGFTARPQVLLPIIDGFTAKQFDVYAPVVAGHGKSVKQYQRSTLRQWLKSACKAVEDNLSKYDNVFVFGHSLGGLYAMYLALKYKQIRGVVTLGTPYSLTSKQDSKQIVENHLDREGYLLGKRLSWGMLTPRNPSAERKLRLKGLNVFILRNYLKRKIKNISQNILNVHSTIDEISAFASQATYQKLSNGKSFSKLILNASTHTYFCPKEIPLICNAIQSFVQNNQVE